MSVFNENKAKEFLASQATLMRSLYDTSIRLKIASLYAPLSQGLLEIARSKNEGLKSFGIHFYGSRMIGVATSASDLDIHLDAKESAIGALNELKSMYNAMLRSPNWKVICIIEDTPVPIIQAIYLPQNLRCDINATCILGKYNSQLIEHLLSIQPQAVYLYHFVRQWLKSQGFDGLKGYAIMLLVIFYLQQKGFMPTVQTVNQKAAKVTILGWDVQFNPNYNITNYGKNLMSSYKDHVKAFFKFYAGLNFSHVISPFAGTLYNAESYKTFQPKFMMKGVLIAGPCNQGNNCGVVEDNVKQNFIDLCKASGNFFDRYSL